MTSVGLLFSKNYVTAAKLVLIWMHIMVGFAPYGVSIYAFAGLLKMTDMKMTDMKMQDMFQVTE